ncbi:MAG: hypothetical protein ACEPOV_07205 [Hyphomicrobiales bacterium]
MNTYKFKTSLKCQGCVDSISPFMNAVSEINDWKVDFNSKPPILEVQSNFDISQRVISIVRSSGFECNYL